MKRPANFGLKLLALLIAFLLWMYVHLIETGRFSLISSITR